MNLSSNIDFENLLINKIFWLQPIWIYFLPPAKAGGNSKLEEYENWMLIRL